ncbi:AI-2E family transporter [Azotobacter chroococcum]|uniref:AI-2E family transporter n=1 Tax=Azotobacter chroococcum TaxID=353 RepID=UPI000B5F9FA5|nr:AI-2E family transporter [Azotobacter chroococcum]ASL27673.1 membrane protein [Azotobacter chroococcum]
MINPRFEYRVFLFLLVLISLAFAWIIIPFYGAIFWAIALAILFHPVQRYLQRRFGEHPNLSAALTLIICVIVAVLPITIISTLLIQEGVTLYTQLEAGEIDFAGLLEDFKARLPEPLQRLLSRFGLDSQHGLRDRIATAAMQGSQFFATQAFNIGQNTFQFILGFFVMLYLLFFFLRDGTVLVTQIREAIPLSEMKKSRLFQRVTCVVQATIKGSIVVAVIQGTLGGVIFAVLGIPRALLWGVAMAFLSFLPALGTGLIWGPVALYLLLSGAILKSVLLTAAGIFIIGLVDNIVRPILVSKDTRIPDYLVLVSTLGGLALFGLNGFVIGPVIAALFVSTWSLFSYQTR